MRANMRGLVRKMKSKCSHSHDVNIRAYRLYICNYHCIYKLLRFSNALCTCLAAFVSIIRALMASGFPTT